MDAGRAAPIWILSLAVLLQLVALARTSWPSRASITALASPHTPPPSTTILDTLFSPVLAGRESFDCVRSRWHCGDFAGQPECSGAFPGPVVKDGADGVADGRG